MKNLTKTDLETKDVETLGDILDEILDYGLCWDEEQIDEFFEDVIKRNEETFELDKADLIRWILHFDEVYNIDR